ncbi:hypothetical protein BGZ68_008024 [Mortierella alpina]|nr:hypothetical protein BGZ68_008024 [Mortierella alpina]
MIMQPPPETHPHTGAGTHSWHNSVENLVQPSSPPPAASATANEKPSSESRNSYRRDIRALALTSISSLDDSERHDNDHDIENDYDHGYVEDKFGASNHNNNTVFVYPERRPLLRRKTFWCCCFCILLIVLLAILLPVLYFVVLPKVVQSIVNGSRMSLSQLNITEPTDKGINVTLLGTVDHAGIFPATIEFPEPILVSFKNKVLGKMQLQSVDITGGKATVNDATYFEIVDKDAFSEFAKELLTTKCFVWTLTSVVKVKVLGFIPVAGINLTKDLTLLGMNGFQNIKLEKFDLPSDAPDNQGALVKLVTSMNNPSPIGVALGSVVLDLFYEGTHLGQVTARDAVLVGGSPSPLTLEGTLYRQSDQQDLENLSVLFSNYLAGKATITTAKGVSVKPDGRDPVSWLSDGIMALTLSVPLQSPVPIQIIQGIHIDDLGIAFHPDASYSPTVQSNSMGAGFKIPFNITISTRSVSNTIAMGYAGKVLGNINNGMPCPASSDIPGQISFSLPPSTLDVLPASQEEFNNFLADLTVKFEQTFTVLGLSSAVAETAMGVVTLTGIPFNSPVTMKGLNFNALTPPVSQVMVASGNSDHIQIDNMVELMNPSSLTVSGGSVLLRVYDRTTNQYLGDLSIPKFNIGPGSNPVATQFLFHPTDTALRDQFLSQYLTGAQFPLHIVGTKASTPLPELQTALSQVSVSSSVSGLIPPPKLITSGEAVATLNTVLGTHQSHVAVTIQNPLATDLYITGLDVQVKWRGSAFGTINDSGHILVPAKGRATTAALVLQHPQDLGFSVYLTTSFLPANPQMVLGGAVIPFELDSQINVNVGGPKGYAARIHYAQTAEIHTKLTILGADLGHAARDVTNISNPILGRVLG